MYICVCSIDSPAFDLIKSLAATVSFEFVFFYCGTQILENQQVQKSGASGEVNDIDMVLLSTYSSRIYNPLLYIFKFTCFQGLFRMITWNQTRAL